MPSAISNLVIGTDGRVLVKTRPRPGQRSAGEPRILAAYLRLSEMDTVEQLYGREGELREAAKRENGVIPPGGIRVENDMDGDRPKPASAFKRKRVVFTLPDGSEVVQYRVIRPVFQAIVREMQTGKLHGMIAEDLDRIARDPRDLEDLIDCAEHHGSVILSLTPGQINLATSDGITMARFWVNMANKSSRDTARRVAGFHTRLHGKTYRGGGAGYGHCIDPKADKYAKRLLLVPDEAQWIQAAYADILDRGLTLTEVVRGMREQRVPTRLDGSVWSRTVLRGVLLKPSVAGFDLHGSELIGPVDYIAPIVTVERWTAMVAHLGDPARQKNRARVPATKYLLSSLVYCGREGCGDRVRGCTRGRNTREPSYVGNCNHVARTVARVDGAIGQAVIDRLSRPDAADLLKPPPPLAEAEAARWRAEARRLRRIIREKNDMHSEGLLDVAEVRRDIAKLRGELAEAEMHLNATSAPDPLEEFRGRPAAQVWESLAGPRRRAVVRALIKRIDLHSGGNRWHFDPHTVKITWREEAGRPAG